MDTQPRLQKEKMSVEMEIDGGARLMGHMFVAQNQRIPDLLNDERDFLPFETTEGLITIVRKSTIRRVTPMNQITLPDIGADPYEIFGVAASVPDEELKSIYHRKVQECHPDKLIAMGMPADFVQLANEKLARINDAYDRIQEGRAQAEAAKPKWVMGG
jgi:DnaJ-domain-containing protein 1